MDKYGALKKYYGYTEFRQGQEAAIDSLLSGRDTLCVMPTGAGKSLCYQLPAILLPGVTIVISPLISLMKDQVGAPKESGVDAAYINSSLSPAQQEEAARRARQGAYKIIYVAPERLSSQALYGLARAVPISMVTVDEAHCVSQWGQDFRPSYLKIADFIASLPKRPVVSAFTATATPAVKKDISAMLGLAGPLEITTGFNRGNLRFSVQKPQKKMEALLSYLATSKERSGIVYCATRKGVDEVCDRLCAAGYCATRYHAGMEDDARRQSQEDFTYDVARVMVATNAFGMGIDKSNVSFVIHYNMPMSIEAYYQEAGRAGRDGGDADCLLLYSPRDVRTNEFLIKSDQGLPEDMDDAARARTVQNNLELLKRMTFYCATTDCLRAYILKYFGEKAPHYCGNCSNCLAHFEETDITVEAQKVISCVRRIENTGRCYGKGVLAQVLKGSKDARLLALGLDKLSTYGIMEAASAKRIGDIADFLVRGGYLLSTEGEYPVLRATREGLRFLQSGDRLAMKLPREVHEKAAAAPGDENADAGLLSALREKRAELAKRARVPAYIIFSDATLRDMCRRAPQDEAQMREVSGVGDVKLAKYGAAFLDVLRRHADSSAPGARVTEAGIQITTSGGELLIQKGAKSAPQRPWTEEEESAIREKYLDGSTIGQLAKEFERAPGAVRARLEKLGL